MKNTDNDWYEYTSEEMESHMTPTLHQLSREKSEEYCREKDYNAEPHTLNFD